MLVCRECALAKIRINLRLTVRGTFKNKFNRYCILKNLHVFKVFESMPHNLKTHIEIDDEKLVESRDRTWRMGVITLRYFTILFYDLFFM